MKSNSLNSILQGVLAFSLLLSVIFFIQFFFKSREFRAHQMELAVFQQTHARINQLIAESVEYSKRDPGIDPLLVSIGAKRPAPSGKPGAK